MYAVLVFFTEGVWKTVPEFTKENFSTLMWVGGVLALILLSIITFRVLGQSSDARLIKYERCLEEYDAFSSLFANATLSGDLQSAILYQQMANEKGRECEQILDD